MTRLIALLAALVISALGACTPSSDVTRADVDALELTIRSLGPNIDPAEARRAAEISYSHSQQLKQDWRVTDAPIVHNAKVINGFRERGLCNDWAQAMTRRLQQENFRTLDVHWATSPPTTFRIIHHSAAISARGDTLEDGVILDPWRQSGDLFWGAIAEDERYNWRPRLEVREELIAASAGS